jgi:PAS domain S-box-containing protein
MNAAGSLSKAGKLPDLLSSAPSAHWDDIDSSPHSVQFYADDARLLDDLTRFIGAALGAGDAAIVLATKAHRDGLAQRIKSHGLDLNMAIRQGRYISLDAAETLSKFMVDGCPDAARFAEVVGGIIDKAKSSVAGERPRVAAFGEMVALLWAEGQGDKAVRLEQLWNELARTRTFSLRCAYPLNSFSEAGDQGPVQRICAEHSNVIPAESYTSLATDEERLRGILFLQQKAQALEAEMRKRVEGQKTLERREAELRDFFDNAVIGLHWVAADGTILWANKAELDLLGYSPEEYIGRGIADFYVDAPVIEDILQRLCRGEELHGYEARLKCKDGSSRLVRIYSNGLWEEDKFVHTRCFTIDISKQKQAEDAILQLAAIVESSADGIVSKDLNGIVTSWNSAAERILGFTAEEIIGQSITRIIPPDLQADEEMILGKIRRGERIEHFQTVRQTKEGERRDVSLTISPIKDKDGHIIGAAKIIRDITQQKKLEQALHTTEQLASVGRLAATVAHEINNPLESVTNLIYLAKTSPELADDVRHYLNCADQELSRVAHIARQTLGFYRDNSRPVWLKLSEVVQDVLVIYRRKLEYKGVTMQERITPDLKLYALEGELKQVLSNLIANAIDASHAGGKVWVCARAVSNSKTGERGIRIVVADNGSGIPVEYRDKLFLPFFTKKEVGTGLGLWITKELIEKAGGSLRVRSRVGSVSGTVMALFLPLKSESSVVQAA